MNINDITDNLSNLLHSENGCQFTDISDGRIEVCDKSGFMILHLNIRSFHKNKDSLLMLLSDLQEKGIIVHVITLCETLLNPASTSLAHLENYHALHNTRDH